MLHSSGVPIVIILVLTCLPSSLSKTLQGVFSSSEARAKHGQYINSFYFYGDSPQITYELSSTSNATPTLYVFIDEDWEHAKTITDCLARLQMARLIFELTDTNGTHAVTSFSGQPRLWHIVYADSHTCSNEQDPQSDVQRYTLQLLNPDVLGNPTVHFGADETGLFRFYQLLLLGYFVIGCIFSPQLFDALHKEGPMQLLIKMLSGATLLQALSVVTMALHMRRYSMDGVGSPLFHILSEMLDVLSQFAMLYMLLSLSLGWSLLGNYKSSHALANIQRKPATKLLSAVAVIQGLLFLWEQFEEQQQLNYHAQRSMAGVFMAFVRIAMAAIFASSLYNSIATERSSLRRDFYSSFTKSCLLWFLCYPMLVLASLIFSQYFRYKFITMGVLLCQCTAVLLLYRVFYSRSLYWEVSALSSYLPLRMDKTLSLRNKLHS